MTRTWQHSHPCAEARHGRRRARFRLAAGLLGLATVVAGCSGGSGSSSSSAAGTLGSSSAAATLSDTPSAPSASPAATAGATGSASGLQADYRRVIDTVLPSVVEIRTQQGLGSGVIYDTKGNIVTNAHVVGTSKQFQVLLAGRAQPVAATLVGTYPADDLAVVRLSNASGVKPATFGRSGDLQVGDIVLAMGNPLGLAATVTDGIVSAVGRTVSEPQGQDSPGATIPDVIQTSAAINPGNSGGALVDLAAQVVGIPTLAAVNPEGGGAAPGIGFAISSDTVNRIAPQLIQNGKVTNSGRAALGVRVTSVTDPQGNPMGVGVVDVTAGGAAAKAGIKAGDVIVSIAGQPTPTTQALAGVLANQKVGATVPVQINHDGSTSTVQVTLGELST